MTTLIIELIIYKVNNIVDTYDRCHSFASQRNWQSFDVRIVLHRRSMYGKRIRVYRSLYKHNNPIDKPFPEVIDQWYQNNYGILDHQVIPNRSTRRLAWTDCSSHKNASFWQVHHTFLLTIKK